MFEMRVIVVMMLMMGRQWASGLPELLTEHKHMGPGVYAAAAAGFQLPLPELPLPEQGSGQACMLFRGFRVSGSRSRI